MVRPGHLAQVEFVRTVEADLPVRMVEYRARVMRREPLTSLRQHVVVLGGGTVAQPVVDGQEFLMRLHVTYLRDHDPGELLANPALAPLAVLGRMDDVPARQATLRAAFEVILTGTEPARHEGLAETAAVLATIYLDPATIHRVWKEAGMPISLGDTDLGRDIERRGELRGELRGRVKLIAALLQSRFGDDSRIPDVAERLAERSESDAVRAATSAESIRDLIDPA